MLGLLAVELAIIGVAGVAESSGPHLLTYHTIAPHDCHIRVAHVIGLEGAAVGPRRARPLKWDDPLLGDEARALVVHLLYGLHCLAVNIRGDLASAGLGQQNFTRLAAGAAEHLTSFDRSAFAEEQAQAPLIQPVFDTRALVLLAVGCGRVVAGAVRAFGQPDSARLLTEVSLCGPLAYRQLRVYGRVARHQGQVRVGRA